SELRLRASVPLGLACSVVAAVGVLHALGAFGAGASPPAASTTLGALGPRLLGLGGSVAGLFLALTFAVSGVLPAPRASSAVLVTGAFLWVTVELFRLARGLGALRGDEDRPLFRREGFWLIAAQTLLYLPMLGSFSLSDPWETHYGEVAREMLARDDWVSTWWAQDGWFWSKPVLDFWVQALAFSALGVGYEPDRMLASVAEGRWPSPEWAARMPVFLMTLVGTYALYRAVARVRGRRAGLLAGLVLTTLPYWFLVAHQTMTDMPYVSMLTASMALLFLALVTDEGAQVAEYEVRVGSRALRLSAVHLVLAAILVAVLPQALYLVSRNLTLHLRPDLTGFRVHADEFFAGSGGGNAGIPGNQGWVKEGPVHRWLLPVGAGAFWAMLALGLAYWKRRETSLKSAYLLAAWFFLALSALAKGAPGLVLPIATVLAFVGITRRYRELERLELGALVVVVLAVAFPWYVQMWARHGHPFIDRLIMHDMYKRAFVHVHDTNSGDDVSFRYYVWQLGYGLFPWTGLAAGGLALSTRRADRTRDGEGELVSFCFAWFIAAFGMFTITLTKFHHYILPLVPPTAVFTALLLDRLLGAGSPARPGRLGSYAALAVLGVTLVTYGLFRLSSAALLGAPLDAPPSRVWAGLAVGLGLIVLVRMVRSAGADAEPPAPSDTPAELLHERAALGAVAVA
ncbi:MAG: glycosyltransferase family 39 protein, partial [Deltaproteobacteria bacterium]|nr:glycosyltransferase family 39 protein [Deltaproteobacteria bacterium]